MLLALSSDDLARLGAARRMALAEALDRLGLSLLVVDLDGRVMHRTSTLEAMLAQEPERARVLEVAEQVAREAARLAWPQRGVEAVRREPVEGFTQEVRTTAARYAIRAVLLGEPEQGGAVLGRPVVLVALERRTPVLPSVERLRERFGLTRREAEVALLLAQRKHNAEIAETLCISAHTARHHTEQVLEKLDVRTRAGVVRVLEGGE